MELYIQLIVTALCTVAYFLTYRYQAKKIEILDKTLNSLQSQITSQSTIISDFEKYKKLFDIDDFEKRLKLKLDNQKDELNQVYKKEIDEASIKTARLAIEIFQKEHEKIINGYEELGNIALAVTLQKFPKKENKIERDLFIAKNYPKNLEYFITFCDEALDGKIPGFRVEGK
jgi:D-ribose pyranose/furanose isomerase RbsD